VPVGDGLVVVVVDAVAVVRVVDVVPVAHAVVDGVAVVGQGVRLGEIVC